MTRHTKKWRQTEVVAVQKLVEQYPVIAIASLEGFPANLFQQIRKKLHGKAVVRVSKVRVLERALKQSKHNDSKLAEKLDGSVALICSKTNPFELYSFLKKNKGKAPAKAGMIAPFDFIVPAHDTGLPPGPALTDLKAAGLSARIQGATIIIPEDTVVAKKGSIVTKAVANTMTKLNIYPLKVGLNLVAAVEDGQLYPASVLDIDEELVFENFVKAHRQSFNLAFNARYLTKETAPLLFQKAFREAKAVALKAGVLNENTIKDLIAKASREALVLQDRAHSA